MAIKPIIFSAPMVRALLAETKTQTRRLLNPQPETFPVDEDGTPCDVYCIHVEGEAVPRIAMGKNGTGVITLQKVPYAVGDRLFVREAMTLDVNVEPAFTFVADGARVKWSNREQVVWLNEYYRKHCPSIHMPRWASRLWLTVTEVRVERLNGISNDDAIAEGIEPGVNPDTGETSGWRDYETIRTGKHKGAEHPHTILPYAEAWRSYSSLWDELHTDPGTRWADNPFVVVYTFTVHEGNVDAT